MRKRKLSNVACHNAGLKLTVLSYINTPLFNLVRMPNDILQFLSCNILKRIFEQLN